MPKAKVWYLCTHGEAKFDQKTGVIGTKVPTPEFGKHDVCPVCRKELVYIGSTKRA